MFLLLILSLTQDRAHRLGQTRPVRVFKLVSAHAIGLHNTFYLSTPPLVVSILTVPSISDEMILKRAESKMLLVASQSYSHLSF